MNLFFSFLFFLFMSFSSLSCEIVNIDSKSINIIKDIKYATESNFSAMKIYKSDFLMLHKDAFEALKIASKKANLLGYQLKIFDGFRPLEAQKALFMKFNDEKFVMDPEKGLAMHTRGLAVDLTLVEIKSSKEIETESYFDDFSDKAYSSFISKSDLAMMNRVILAGIMSSSGFSVYPYEWWHYDFVPNRDFSLLNTKKYKKCSQKELNLDLITEEVLSYIKN